MEVVILGLAAVACTGSARGGEIVGELEGELLGVSPSEFGRLKGLAYIDLGTKLCLGPIFNDSAAMSASLTPLQWGIADMSRWGSLTLALSDARYIGGSKSANIES